MGGKSQNSKNGGNKNKGCLSVFLALLVFSVALAIYSFAWIPAIVCIIYFAIRKDLNGTKRRNILISSGVFVTSLIVFVWLGTANSLTSIHADWGKTTYDITDIAEIKISTTPSDADIDSLELAANNIAELDYSDGKAIITFKKAGEATLFFTANDDIKSNSVTITVTDKAAEEAEKKAEEERIAAEQAATQKAEEEARLKAEEEARLKAEEAARKAEEEKLASEKASTEIEEPQEQMVWIAGSGSKYHSRSSCSNMTNPREVTITEAKNSGRDACKKCY